jgi:hypothetical protein
MDAHDEARSGNLNVALDYSVLDHLQRIETGTYRGLHRSALERLRDAASAGRIVVWISEICYVEMLHGIEHLPHDAAKRRDAEQKDAKKRAIAERMGARILGYPCSKFDDTYSRWDLSFRFAGPDSESASALEERLEALRGISRGDARHLVSCAYPFDGDAAEYHPRLDWFVSEDHDLLEAVTSEIHQGRLPELADIRFGTSEDFAASNVDL